MSNIMQNEEGPVFPCSRSLFPISSYRILVVFKVAAEMVASVFLGNKIKVFFLGRIESSLERFSSWAADRAGRKTPVAVCIIGRF